MNKLQRDIEFEDGGGGVAIAPSNTIFTIEPYRMGNIYVFDVPEWGVIAEAFISGAETFLEKLSNNANRMTAVFSSKPFPNAHRIDKLEEDGFGGTWYYSEELQHKLWLCSFTYKYWSKPPASIYVYVIPIK